nr:tyrosine-type recombinase/integrase [Leptolyngbya sp. FACHB-238]
MIYRDTSEFFIMLAVSSLPQPQVIPFPTVFPIGLPTRQPLAIAHTTEDLIELWLHDKSPNTQDNYRRDLRYFLEFINHKSLHLVMLNDLQAFADFLIEKGYASETRRRRLVAIKSLLTFGHDLDILSRNVGRTLKLPKVKITIAERILTEVQVFAILEQTKTTRNYALLRFMYATGARVSEICNLRWRDLREATEDRGQVTLFGKGQKTRMIIFSAETWKCLKALRNDASEDSYVFQGLKGKALHRTQIARILTQACQQAGIGMKVSPHWFRHSHASHALERGTPITLVQNTLGHASLATTGIYLHVRPQDSSALYLAV